MIVQSTNDVSDQDGQMSGMETAPISGSRVPILGLLESFSRSLDLVSPTLLDHHRKTAWLSHRIAQAAGLRGLELRTVVFAALLHDIGCLSLAERFRCLEFERSFHDVEQGEHAEIGYHLLREFAPFAEIAKVVRHQHRRWDLDDSDSGGDAVPIGSHALHLADRVAVCLLPHPNSKRIDRDEIRRRVEVESGKMFHPDLVRAFLDSSDTWDWLDLARHDAPSLANEDLPGRSMRLGDAELRALARLFSRIIDFRSLHTATHSSGVAATGEILARLVGFPEIDCGRMFVAGLFHDLGKIAIPAELLDKPGRLTPDEYEIVKSHVIYTDRIVEPLGDLGGVRAWAAQHHERSDGRGYPRGLAHDEIALGGRVLAVADVFTALTESRPYRRGLSPEEALREIGSMSSAGELDRGVVSVLSGHSGTIDEVRGLAQTRARVEYDEFRVRAGL